MLLMRKVLGSLIVSVVLAGCVGAAASPPPSPGTSPQPEPSTSVEPDTSLEPGPSVEPSPRASAAATAGTGEASPGASVIVPDTSPDGTPPTTPRPTLPPLELVGLRYRLVDELGRPLFCDPDYYPIARADESVLAQERYPEIRADTPTHDAITAHLGIDPATTPTAGQMLAIYREWKMLNALVLEPANGAYRFDYIASSAAGAEEGGASRARSTARVDRRRTPRGVGHAALPDLPGSGTAIATPVGPIAVEDLRPEHGRLDRGCQGRRVSRPGRHRGFDWFPPTHRVVHLVSTTAGGWTPQPGHRCLTVVASATPSGGDLVDAPSSSRQRWRPTTAEPRTTCCRPGRPGRTGPTGSARQHSPRA
jgi:hypothetical protein